MRKKGAIVKNQVQLVTYVDRLSVDLKRLKRTQPGSEELGKGRAVRVLRPGAVDGVRSQRAGRLAAALFIGLLLNWIFNPTRLLLQKLDVTEYQAVRA